MWGRCGVDQLNVFLLCVSVALCILGCRALENRRYLIWKSRITDGKNRYYRCPNCKQTVRVPRGRGKICIKCPKCGEKFIRKS